jgi:hypothetical protein
MKAVYIPALLSILMLWGCSSTKVVSDQAKKVNFKQYNSYTWGANEHDETEGSNYFNNDLVDRSIRAQADRELTMRGFEQDEQNPDLKLVYYTFTERKTKQVQNNMYPSGMWGWGRPMGMSPWGMGGFNSMRTVDYTEGKVVIDAIDIKTGELVWRGSIANELDNQSQFHKVLATSVEAIFTKFPRPMKRQYQGLHRDYIYN